MPQESHLSPPSALQWREWVQARARQLLAERRPVFARMPPADWHPVKARWRALIREAAAEALQCRSRPLDAHLVSEKNGDGFRLQNIVLTSFPGWLVGLNLYLPPGPGPFAPVLCPCGHGPKWQDDHQLPPQVLARNGFAAALFDMPMFGEKRRGNDHFIQGAQAQMLGIWSNVFFLADALRVADYLHTRTDIAGARGMGVTGVSGGGFATLFLALLDDRVRAIAPVCATASFLGHVVEGLYTGCPENYLWNQIGAGLDFEDLLALSAPVPALAMGGLEDRMFREAIVRAAVARAQAAYALEGVPDRVAVFFDRCPHKYTVPMAREAVRWFRRWLLAAGDAPVDASPAVLLPTADLDCGTGEQTGAMTTYLREALDRVQRERVGAYGDADLRRVLGMAASVRPAEIVAVPPAGVWGYEGLTRRQARTADGLTLPLIEMPCPTGRPGVLVAFTDGEHFDLLRQNGGFFGLMRTLVAADLRGYGALKPAPSDYDMYSWCAIDRALSDILYVCGETAAGQQTSDVWTVLEATAGEGLIVYGRGEAALPALLGGLLHARVARIVLDGFPAALELLVREPRPAWSRYLLVPGVLPRFDLPDLMAHRPDKRFLLLDPRDALRRPLPEPERARLFGGLPAHVTLPASAPDASPCDAIAAWLAAAEPASGTQTRTARADSAVSG